MKFVFQSMATKIFEALVIIAKETPSSKAKIKDFFDKMISEPGNFGIRKQ